MAAVTFDSGPRNSVWGDLVALTGQIDIAADGDTWATNLGTILFVAATSETNNAIGATVSGGTVAFQTAGAEANVKALVIGTY